MSGLLVNACSEEPDALIALVRVCGGAPRVTGGSTRKNARKQRLGREPFRVISRVSVRQAKPDFSISLQGS